MLFGKFSTKNIRYFVQRERQSPAHFPLQVFDQFRVQVAQLDPTPATKCEQHSGEVERAVQHVVAVGEFGFFAVLSHIFVIAQQRVGHLKFHKLISIINIAEHYATFVSILNDRTYVNTRESSDERAQDLICSVAHPSRGLILALINLIR